MLPPFRSSNKIFEMSYNWITIIWPPIIINHHEGGRTLNADKLTRHRLLWLREDIHMAFCRFLCPHSLLHPVDTKRLHRVCSFRQIWHQTQASSSSFSLSSPTPPTTQSKPLWIAGSHTNINPTIGLPRTRLWNSLGRKINLFSPHDLWMTDQRLTTRRRPLSLCWCSILGQCLQWLSVNPYMDVACVPRACRPWQKIKSTGRFRLSWPRSSV